jgi:hypothetical protein
VAATHHDEGRNYVVMIAGAKRYILGPPKICSKLGIIPHRPSPFWRHSMLDFGKIQYLNDSTVRMSKRERYWLQQAANAEQVETVVKQGEALYIPAHWFHYIIGLQKSTQCNCRSGDPAVAMENPAFGGRQDVGVCGQPKDQVRVFDHRDHQLWHQIFA